MKPTEEELQRLRQRLAEIEAEMPQNMNAGETAEYLVSHGYAREMTPEQVKERYGGYGVTTLTFIGVPKLRIRRGDIVMVQESSGAWRNNMVAAAANVDGLIYVAEEVEWQRAEAEGREAAAVAYPAERVKRVEATASDE